MGLYYQPYKKLINCRFVMRLEQLKLILLLERYGTLSAVSKILNTTQSTVSYNLKELEKELDTQLFLRDGTRLKFSPKGRQLIPRIEIIEQAQRNILNIAQKARTHTLSGKMLIGYDSRSCGRILVESLIELKKRAPGINASMYLAGHKNIIEKITYKEFSAGIIQTNSLNEVEILNLILSNPLNHQLLFSEDIFFVAGEQHPLCAKPSCLLSELMQYQFITSKKISENMYTKFLQKNGNKKKLLFVPDYQSQHSLLEQCDYITFMPYSAFREASIIHKYRLKIIKLDDFVCKCNFWLISNGKTQSSAEQEMLKELYASVQNVLKENA